MQCACHAKVVGVDMIVCLAFRNGEASMAPNHRQHQPRGWSQVLVCILQILSPFYHHSSSPSCLSFSLVLIRNVKEDRTIIPPKSGRDDNYYSCSGGRGNKHSVTFHGRSRKRWAETMANVCKRQCRFFRGNV